MALCPYCQQALPETPERYCPRCGADLEAGTVGFPPPLPSGTPWDQRGEFGFASALVETTKQVLGSPGQFFRGLSVAKGIGGPLLYGVIVGYVGLVAAALYQAVFRTIVGSSFGGFAERSEWARAAQLLEGWGGLALQVVLGPVFILLGLFISAGIFHVMLLALGGARREFEVSLSVVSYAQATALFGLVPFCGQLIAAVYSIVLYIIGLAEAHGIGKGKAAAAVLLPFLLLCCCCVALVAIFAGGLATLLGHAR